jgi:ADP-ribose pyrophosphatase
VGTFTRLGQTLHFEGSMVSAGKVHCRAPDGTAFDRDIVLHPGAVAVVPIDDDGNVLLVQQYRSAMDSETLELPAGVCDKEGEQRADAARRELIEEAGLVAGRLDELVTIHTAPGFCDEEITIFVARDLSEVETAADGVEEQHMTSHWVPLADVDEMITSGRLSDAKTVLALTMVILRG